MSTANATAPDVPLDPSHTPHHRRSREDMEALAKNFVATPVQEAPARVKPYVKIALAAGGVALLAVVAIVAWPSREEAARPAQSEANRAAAEVEQLRQRLEAERERKRQELTAGKEYLERIAAADAALVSEVSDRAQNLAERTAAAAPVPSSELPTPREELARTQRSAPAKAATATTPTPPPTSAAPASAPPQQVAKAAPVEAAPAEAPPKADCAIHVSELSANGKLTYADITRMKGVRLDEATGHAFTPPVKAAGGRTMVFEVMPDGCVRVARR